MSVWGQWSGCLSSCVDHYDDFKTSMVKHRHIIQRAQNGGKYKAPVVPFHGITPLQIYFNFYVLFNADQTFN